MLNDTEYTFIQFYHSDKLMYLAYSKTVKDRLPITQTAVETSTPCLNSNQRPESNLLLYPIEKSKPVCKVDQNSDSIVVDPRF